MNKHIASYIAAAATAMAFAGCDDFLDEAPRDLISGQGLYSTAEQAEKGVRGIYSNLRFVSEYEYGQMAELRSDAVWVDPKDNKNYGKVSHFNADASTDIFEACWNTWYKVIADANNAIEGLEGAQFENAAFQSQLTLEARFLRGWAHFELARLFGSVPIITSTMTPSEAATVPQSDAKSVMEQVVIPDLTAALALPERAEMKGADGSSATAEGRADKRAAQAMLARVYTTLAGFPFNDASATAKAEEMLDSVLSVKADYFAPTIDDWRKIWTSQDGTFPYTIFSIQHRSGGTGNPYVFSIVRLLPGSYVGNRIFRDKASNNFARNNIFCEKTLRFEYERKHTNGIDGRGMGWSVLGFYEDGADKYKPGNESVTVDGVTLRFRANGLIYKPVPTVEKLNHLGLSLDYTTVRDYLDWPVNFPVLRVEDMMLLKAELLAKAGKTDEAMALVNEIRLRAGCDAAEAADSETAMKLIARERRIEFLAEGVRWFDEVRYGTWMEDLKAKFELYGSASGANIKPGHYVFPIPQNQLNIAPGLYKQNEDY